MLLPNSHRCRSVKDPVIGEQMLRGEKARTSTRIPVLVAVSFQPAFELSCALPAHLIFFVPGRASLPDNSPAFPLIVLRTRTSTKPAFRDT